MERKRVEETGEVAREEEGKRSRKSRRGKSEGEKAKGRLNAGRGYRENAR